LAASLGEKHRAAVEQSTRREFLINLGAAKALSSLFQADEVFE
jgi:hypothetical protein